MAEQGLPYIIWDIIKELFIYIAVAILFGIPFFSILLLILLIVVFYPQLCIIAFIVFLCLNLKSVPMKNLE
jgi:hypothetical protein